MRPLQIGTNDGCLRPALNDGSDTAREKYNLELFALLAELRIRFFIQGISLDCTQFIGAPEALLVSREFCAPQEQRQIHDMLEIMVVEETSHVPWEVVDFVALVQRVVDSETSVPSALLSGSETTNWKVKLTLRVCWTLTVL